MIAGLAVPFVARATGIESGPLAILVALSPWLALAWLIPIATAVLARALDLLIVALIPALLSAAWQLPLVVGGHDGEPVLTVASVNATFGAADAEAVVRLVQDNNVDLLAVQELTPEFAAALDEAGIGHHFSYSEIDAREGATGTGLWTRLPVTSSTTVGGFTSAAIEATLDLHGTETTVLAVHPAAPGLLDHSAWTQDLAELRLLASETRGAVMVLGDLNATTDHAAFRALERGGFEDAGEEAGAGFLPTFPEGRTPFPLVTLDHALTRDLPLAASTVLTEQVEGADHRALIVSYVVVDEE